MLEVLALCAGCACVSCLGCAIATVLTCPRISNLSPQCQEPGNCYQWNPCNHAQNYPGNIPHHPVMIFPMEYPSCIDWNFRPSISSSTSALQSSSITGNSSSTTNNSCTSLGPKVPLRGNENVSSIPHGVASASNNGAEKLREEVENDARRKEFPPTPPPRLKRNNRVRSMVKSKLKKRTSGIKNFSNSVQKTFEFHRESAGAAGFSPDEPCANDK